MTERAPGKPTPWLALTPIEWRLYITALLAAIYAVVWRAITGAAPPPVALHTVPPPPASPHVRWLHEVPVAERPVLDVPAGWRVVTPGASVPAVAPARAPQIVRVPSPRRVRVRTRSS